MATLQQRGLLHVRHHAGPMAHSHCPVPSARTSVRPCQTHAPGGQQQPAWQQIPGQQRPPVQQQRRQQRCRPTQAVPPAVVDAITSLAAQSYWDGICFVLAAACAFLWVKAFDMLATSGVLEQKLSRKLVHSTAGPLFVLTWPLFSTLPYARFAAVAVPFLNLLRLSLVGSGVLQDPGLVHSVSRQGDRTELLRGPLYYVVMLVSCTLLFWRTDPAGLVAISMMCGGDGLADIVGRRLGRGNPLPWNGAKSFAGSAAMFLGGLGMAMGFIAYFSALGFMQPYQPQTLLTQVAAVCFVATFVESLPINEWLDDNISVPAVSTALSLLLLPGAAVASAGGVVPAGPFALLQLLYG